MQSNLKFLFWKKVWLVNMQYKYLTIKLYYKSTQLPQFTSSQRHVTFLKKIDPFENSEKMFFNFFSIFIKITRVTWTLGNKTVK